jgi:creatinine amidohydrolase/Fe(II)-dependent formamide hydrolase-like protein
VVLSLLVLVACGAGFNDSPGGQLPSNEQLADKLRDTVVGEAALASCEKGKEGKQLHSPLRPKWWLMMC